MTYRTSGTYWTAGLLALLLALGGCAGTTETGSAASAAASESAQQVAARTEADDDEGVICRQVQRTGTRISDRVCTTRAQRKAAAEASRDAVNSIGIGATQVGGLPDGG